MRPAQQVIRVFVAVAAQMGSVMHALQLADKLYPEYLAVLAAQGTALMHSTGLRQCEARRIQMIWASGAKQQCRRLLCGVLWRRHDGIPQQLCYQQEHLAHRVSSSSQHSPVQCHLACTADIYWVLFGVVAAGGSQASPVAPHLKGYPHLMHETENRPFVFGQQPELAGALAAAAAAAAARGIRLKVVRAALNTLQPVPQFCFVLLQR
jgi:hypothetical protein